MSTEARDLFVSLLSRPREALGPEETIPCRAEMAVLCSGSRTAHAPVAMPPGRDSHFKAPDTVPHFKDTAVLQFQGWQASSSPKEDLGWG